MFQTCQAWIFERVAKRRGAQGGEESSMAQRRKHVVLVPCGEKKKDVEIPQKKKTEKTAPEWVFSTKILEVNTIPIKPSTVLLMAEILHQLIGSFSIIYRVSYIPGGAGFQPSTVVLLQHTTTIVVLGMPAIAS